MYKLEFTLKEHTPIIHFQHDQDGATLRATEVKPKLDRFIIKHKYNDDFDLCKEYLVGYNPKQIKDLKQKFDKEQDMKKHLKAQSVKIKKLVNGFKLLSLETEDFAKKE